MESPTQTKQTKPGTDAPPYRDAVPETGEFARQFSEFIAMLRPPQLNQAARDAIAAYEVISAAHNPQPAATLVRSPNPPSRPAQGV